MTGQVTMKRILVVALLLSPSLALAQPADDPGLSETPRPVAPPPARTTPPPRRATTPPPPVMVPRDEAPPPKRRTRPSTRK